MSVTAPIGFVAGGVAAGIKPDGRADLAMVAAAEPVPVAAVFTVSRAPAAPVELSKRHMAESPFARAVLINSGCANAGTGAAGSDAAMAGAVSSAKALGCDVQDVLVCSTGSIGMHLDAHKVSAGIEKLAPLLGPDASYGKAAATAIMTTDTVSKEAVAAAHGFTVGGMIKGAGMIRPDMATMIAIITTDAAAEPDALDEALRVAVDESFHSINIDGCPSTNDTVILMASGASGVSARAADLAGPLGEVCASLARQIAADAEGASKVVTLHVKGAIDDATARRMGREVADSALVRASFYGRDPNWGRVLGALGAGSSDFDQRDVSIDFCGVPVARGGVGVGADDDAISELMAGDFDISISVGDGPGAASILTTDLTPEYVKFNGERS